MSQGSSPRSPAPRAAGGWRALLGPGLALLCRVALGVVFVWAAWDKILDPAAFARSIANYHLVPLEVINLMAIALPWIELSTGVALILGLGIRPGLLLCAGMLGVFIFAIASAMSRHLDISCGCFSVSPEATRMTLGTLIWDIIWLGMALYAMVWDRGLLSLEAVWRRRGSGDLRRASGST